MSISQQSFDALIDIARDLTSSLAADDRYERLLDAVREIIPFDAACLLRLDGDELVPVAAHGLTHEALARRYPRREHPRLDLILAAAKPVLFPPDSALPDPFDGQLEADPHALEHIHACLGCPLAESGQVVGALTADALAPDAFDGLDEGVLTALGALAGAALHTTALIEALEQKAERQGALVQELQRALRDDDGLVGSGPAMTRLRREIEVVAGSDLPVLITGETGVGKEVVTRQLHRLSGRRDEPLVQVNCAALPEAIAESELFGHVSGAFTGATRDRTGKFELADGATLFLDEIGELPLTLQPKLLRALQEGEVQRVGDEKIRRVDVRILAATNRDLEQEVAAGRFRADLYHRIAVYPIRVPALRERLEDIPLLAAHFLEKVRRRLGLGAVRLSMEARELLLSAEWPGNVRELENVISRAVVRAAAGTKRADVVMIPRDLLGLRRQTVRDAVREGNVTEGSGRTGFAPSIVGSDTSTRAHLGDGPFDTSSGQEEIGELVHHSGPLRDRIDEFRRLAIRAAVARHSGNWAAAARELGMDRGNLHHLARRLGVRE
ncbi:MAG: nitric oxide reductase transcriptional regulator NorR [Candidatus Eisenbacteria bacterium]|uniref:Nitric oxide reductase transcriptional regulator NorR n=1 Tax=Eiseniibacteriota bacterium TaxID=2212470 RepID=A0A956NG85_UNCEI|nr:nitric oxide reductase transcriptional regulator NorR [Candidatus Eisenbacteria bacterium]MCB9466398.1 nitric oxide reductase transcriptional regulator NorR [Candidatus Eisenbacteria bacterium]